MKLANTLQFAGFGLLSLALAGVRGDSSNCCKFTLSSSGSFTCPAGQLDDGQIRLNGTYPASTFCIGPDGGITDEHGFGCIVTDPPTTQFQCDSGKSPDKNFSISPNNMLEYKGSPSFFACAATDTEYNVYISPNFGQSKCFPITLQASGCGAQAPSSSCPSPELQATTIWQTQWATVTQTQSMDHTMTVTQTLTQTQWVTATQTQNMDHTLTVTQNVDHTMTITQNLNQTVTFVENLTETMTEIIEMPCSSSSSSMGWNSTSRCRICTKTPSSGGMGPTGGIGTTGGLTPMTSDMSPIESATAMGWKWK